MIGSCLQWFEQDSVAAQRVLQTTFIMLAPTARIAAARYVLRTQLFHA